jgi:hypothetical protein
MIEQMMELKYNCSTFFLLQPLDLDLRKMIAVGFVNSYLKTSSRIGVECDNPIYVLFKKPENDGGKFADFLITQLNKNEHLIEEIDCEEHTLLIYCLPEEFNGDYELFLSGKYSKFSRKFKSKFKKYKDNNKNYAAQYMIINKHPDWKQEVEEYFNTSLDYDDELWKLPDLKKETLNTEELCIMQ